MFRIQEYFQLLLHHNPSVIPGGTPYKVQTKPNPGYIAFGKVR